MTIYFFRRGYRLNSLKKQFEQIDFCFSRDIF
jgi:hypothetical protein